MLTIYLIIVYIYKIVLACVCRKERSGQGSKGVKCPASVSVSKTGTITFSGHNEDCMAQAVNISQKKALTGHTSMTDFKRSLDNSVLDKFTAYVKDLKDQGIEVKSKRIAGMLKLFMKSKFVLVCLHHLTSSYIILHHLTSSYIILHQAYNKLSLLLATEQKDVTVPPVLKAKFGSFIYSRLRRVVEKDGNTDQTQSLINFLHEHRSEFEYDIGTFTYEEDGKRTQIIDRISIIDKKLVGVPTHISPS